jgi:hypothetical protein
VPLLGDMETERVTAPEKPPILDSVRVLVPEAPRVMFMPGGLADI